MLQAFEISAGEHSPHNFNTYLSTAVPTADRGACGSGLSEQGSKLEPMSVSPKVYGLAIERKVTWNWQQGVSVQ